MADHRLGPSGVARGALLQTSTAAGYLALAWVASRFAVLDSLSVWYAPAGLAVGLGALHGWRALPGLAAGELLVGLLLFGVLDDFGWLIVPNGIAYAATYVAAGVLLAQLGGTEQDPRWRNPALLLLLAGLGAPLAGATVGMTFQVVAGSTDLAGFLPGVGVWALGDAIGIVSIGVTVVSVVVRRRRGAPWYALTETSVPMSMLLVLTPPLLAVVLATITGGGTRFAALLFVPMLALAVTKGVAAVALTAPLTSLVITAVADTRFSDQVVALADLQVLLLVLLLTSLGAALVTEERTELLWRLGDKERHLRQSQQQARSGSFLWNVIDDEVEWSSGLYSLYGIEEGPVTAGDYIARVHQDDRARVALALAETLETEQPHSCTYRVVRADGDVVKVRARIQVRSFDGRVIEVLGTCMDVTEDEETKDRLAEAIVREQEALLAQRAATELVERTERIKDALLVAVSHEVRTPLTIVRGLAETLSRPELADSRLGDHGMLLRRLDHHTRRLQAVLRDLLDVDRIGRGVVTPVRRPCDLGVLCDEVIAGLRLEHPVVVSAPPVEVAIDTRLTARILEHLISNAVQHAPDGTPIDVRVTVDADTVEIIVEDQGSGVPEEHRVRVFEAFEQHGVVEHSPGTGVGLFLVSRFAELHGGRAWVTDRNDSEGASFRVTLQLEGAMARDASTGAR